MLEDPISSSLVGLGEGNRFLQIHPDQESYANPVKKLSKFKKHLSVAEDVTFLPGSQVAVCDQRRMSVKIFDSNGQFSKTLVRGFRPIGIAATASGMVAVIDSKPRKEKLVKVFSSDNADLFSKWGEEFDWKPRGLTFSNKGHLVITDVKPKQHSVGIYTLDGHEMRKFGTQGTLANNFNYPGYVAVDMFDRILVSDRDNHAVKVFDDRGHFLGLFGNKGKGPGQLRYPRGLCSDSRGNIIVCDTGNRRVCVFSVDGRYIQDLLTKEDALGYPYDVAYDKESRRLAVTQHRSSESGSLRKTRIYELDQLPPLKIVPNPSPH